MGYICNCCDEGLPEDTPCPCTFGGETEYDCRRCGEPWADEEGGLCSDCSDTLQAAAEKRAATRKANSERRAQEGADHLRQELEKVPSGVRPVYLATTKDQYELPAYGRVVKAVHRRFSGCYLTEPKGAFCGPEEWKAKWAVFCPFLIDRRGVLVIWPRPERTIGAGVYQELASVSKYKTSMNDWDAMPARLVPEDFEQVDVFVVGRNRRLHRLAEARITGGVDLEIVKEYFTVSKPERPPSTNILGRSYLQRFAEVIRGDEVP